MRCHFGSTVIWLSLAKTSCTISQFLEDSQPYQLHWVTFLSSREMRLWNLRWGVTSSYQNPLCHHLPSWSLLLKTLMKRKMKFPQDLTLKCAFPFFFFFILQLKQLPDFWTVSTCICGIMMKDFCNRWITVFCHLKQSFHSFLLYWIALNADGLNSATNQLQCSISPWKGIRGMRECIIKLSYILCKSAWYCNLIFEINILWHQCVRLSVHIYL